jgi:hypothetical protein
MPLRGYARAWCNGLVPSCMVVEFSTIAANSMRTLRVFSGISAGHGRYLPRLLIRVRVRPDLPLR